MTSQLERYGAHLTSGNLLARNAVWNLVGSAAPMLVAIFCIPILIRGLGTDRFGVLTLTWAVIGYASLFDLGLGRALTQLVASKLGAREEQEVPTLVWTSLLLMALLGLLGAGILIVLSPWLVRSALHVSSALQPETLYSFYLLGLSIPFVIGTAGLRGLLEARQRFGIINALRVPMGIFTFLGPLLVLPFSTKLYLVVAVLVFGRVLAWAVHLMLCMQVVPGLRRHIEWNRAAVGPLLRFGGWMTLSNVVGPVMVTFDRFLIGALVSVTAVAYYATPYELVTKFWLFPGALAGVMFPAFSTSSVENRSRTALLYGRSVKYLLLILFPMVLLVVGLAHDGLRLWLGAEFAQHSTHVLQWLAVGVLINSLAQIPCAALQGVGRPDLTAKLHTIEMPVYLIALWWLTSRYGIEGTAITWTARASVDAMILFIMAKRLFRLKSSVRTHTTLLVAVAFVTLALAALLQGLVLKGIFLFVTILGFVLIAWFLVLSPEERRLPQELLYGSKPTTASHGTPVWHPSEGFK
jgi:O-antigen/teichoic acid export membrane protein